MWSCVRMALIPYEYWADVRTGKKIMCPHVSAYSLGACKYWAEARTHKFWIKKQAGSNCYPSVFSAKQFQKRCRSCPLRPEVYPLSLSLKPKKRLDIGFSPASLHQSTYIS